MSTPTVPQFGPGPPDRQPRSCPWCREVRWVLISGGVWWCTKCDGPVPIPPKRRPLA